ncbi:YggS family pyridoxal phosphate-dependent enzyme, partial [Mesorhizobium sp. M4A.F.Ca.ET.020.02.1.1]
MTSAVEQLFAVKARIAAAEREAGRDQGAVTLVAVSKTFEAASISPVIEAGQRVFGENRVQEAQGKWPALKHLFPGIELHLIGPLQSNKAREAVTLFDVIETVDREKIAAELAKEMARQGRTPKLYVQVNTGSEPQKAGIEPREAVAFVKRCREVHGLAVEGL